MTSPPKSRPARRTSISRQDKIQARNPDPAVREKLAGREDLAPELLYFLAGDEAPAVRRQIALNPSTPPQADLVLARDKEEAIRVDLAGKVAPQASKLGPEDGNVADHVAWEVIDVLVRDQITRVRCIVAESLKDVAGVPSRIVHCLVRDPDAEIAGAVLEHTPVLSDDELVELVRSGISARTLEALGRRHGLAPSVCDAVVETWDVAAVTSMLSNASAQVREETLDRIITRAPTVEAWHEPLARRPLLPPGASECLARFIGNRLICVILDRTDLDRETRAAVRAEARRRLADPDQAGEDSDALEARCLFDVGSLTDKVVTDAVRAGRKTFAAHALALRSGLPPLIVERILRNHSAKGVIAVCWKASLPMKLAEELQRRIAKVPPRNVIKGRDDHYPMSPGDMDWQLELFADMAGQDAGQDGA